jgi:predicted AlkP superfamily pyrophosphatase or phosphodiesterase
MDVMPYVLESEMLTKCRRVLEQPGPIFLVLYYSGIDTLEHKYGPYSDEVTNEIQAFEYLLKNSLGRLSEATKRETLMMLTSDHGVQATQQVYYVKDIPDIWGRLQLPPVCDSRCGFLFARQEEKENLRSAFERNFEGFKLIASSELAEKAAFGDPTRATSLLPLIGDWAALSKGPTALSYPYYEDERNREQHGGHGGMTAEEVIVPLLSIRLSKT